ncbi:MAG TPA: DUF456 domain-containing protein [Spirochaetia bacterium]|nr:DUF456 domain-containing protein [Spirochaetia bacterium]
MALSISMVVLGSIFLVIGLIGCIVPALPGPLLAYLALILISIPGAWAVLPVWVLVVLGVLAVATVILDNVLPAMSSKKAGASKAGIWGSVLGMIVGSFFTPIGTIIGAFVGALAGEIVFNPENKEPLKAAAGVFRGTVLAIMLKLVATGIIGWYFVRGSIRLFS